MFTQATLNLIFSRFLPQHILEIIAFSIVSEILLLVKSIWHHPQPNPQTLCVPAPWLGIFQTSQTLSHSPPFWINTQHYSVLSMSYFGDPVLRNTFLSRPYTCLHLTIDDMATICLSLLRTPLKTRAPSKCFGNANISLAKPLTPGSGAKLGCLFLILKMYSAEQYQIFSGKALRPPCLLLVITETCPKLAYLLQPDKDLYAFHHPSGLFSI